MAAVGRHRESQQCTTLWALPNQFDIETGENILWSAPLGTETYGNPVVANGKIFVGTNNGSGFVERLPPDIDLGVLICLNEKNGSFLWQLSCEKLASGRAQDCPILEYVVRRL